MRYDNIIQGTFISRPNRFTAIVSVNGRQETVHVKNTGRCRELLINGCDIWLTAPGTPGRKTRYDLVAVRKDNGMIINIDSQAPNKAVGEWLGQRGYDRIVPEYPFGESRIDFYMERGSEHFLMEVKGCTLERDGIGYFPDAPTERGIKHIYELIRAREQGYRAVLAFVIQMNGMTEVRPNTDTHPEFGRAWQDALDAGVKILFLGCRVSCDEIVIVTDDEVI
ncbi:MAG: DNA/RNA nuclease SfsA [Oscillospiraceae bacterium]|nr:DNA/RNA nuclease SfsA [Oscillospiraceae bacterium]